MTAVVTDWFFAVPAMRVAEARAAIGASPTWVYRFDHPAPADNQRLEACQGVELPFVFDTIGLDETHPRIGDHPSRGVADNVHRIWVEFITSGDPGWAPYTPGDRTTGVLSDAVEAVDDPDDDERQTWDGIR